MQNTYVNTVSIARFVYEAGYINPKHMHDFFHMIFVVGGKAQLNINSQQYSIGANMLFLFPPHFEHEFICDKTQLLTTLEVKFYVNDADFYSKLVNAGIIFESDIEECKKWLESSIDEAANKTYLHMDIVNASMFFLLLKLLKRQVNDYTDNHTSVYSFETISPKSMKILCGQKNIDFAELIKFIEKDYKNSITLQKLSRLVGLNPTYMCHLFKETYGVSPIQYANNIRLQKAKELMLYTNLSITKVAEESGFQTVHYFSRYFKKRENITPAQFKSIHASSILIKFDNYLENV